MLPYDPGSWPAAQQRPHLNGVGLDIGHHLGLPERPSLRPRGRG